MKKIVIPSHSEHQEGKVRQKGRGGKRNVSTLRLESVPELK